MPDTTTPQTREGGNRPFARTYLWLTLIAGAALVGSYLATIHFRYRQQIEAVAVVERLGGSVSYQFRAPVWLKRLQPETGFWEPEPLGPQWVREWLPAKRLVTYTLVVDTVWLDNGPGQRAHSDLSGERREVETEDPTDADMAAVAKFSGLQALYLRKTRISNTGLSMLRPLREIETLALAFTQITDDGLGVVAGFEKLKTLRLCGTNITDAGLAKLVNLKHLEELDVRGTHVSEAGLKPFRSRAGLQILWDDPSDHSLRLLIHY